ncbi:vWA domain-containing protein [Pedobacter boryungensis]|uniref:von Willebrand factor type A domain-containing protein n=1 Tax=Pedobacter boryungensis TaxID=869962 RepID=A0ABX2DF77_9SPHI|nr:VWA domain-containing protein [Pedobacter boryungensis]NQX31804.1 von Willebrand factor type A domain-containing protein [Pedobacter boryungensis]
MKKFILPILALLILVGFKAATIRTITGVVISNDDNLPILGVYLKSLPSNTTASTDKVGKFSINIPETDTKVVVSSIGFETQTLKLGKSNNLTIKLKADTKTLNEVVMVGAAQAQQEVAYNKASKAKQQAYSLQSRVAGVQIMSAPNFDTESYAGITENGFKNPLKDALSTFSIDVDAASYSNVRRFINNGTLPPKDAVRIEEMINYFDYNYAQPTGNDPINIQTELAPAPWNPKHRLVQIGLKAKTIATDNLPASNLVFLIDVSGSMSSANKLPLLISSLKLLTDQLRDKDKVAIVVYAGQSGLVLPSTSGDAKASIKDALNKLSAGGSTAGGAGLQLAYKVAGENFIKGGNNRIILATDGDFNVGISSDNEMERLIEEKRKSGIFLTVLGYGMGNYKDSKMEILANKGNGNYAYIDNINEARKVLVNEFGGTLFTVAKDVKLQIEFNPAKVQAYRLIGYENRMLKDEDFNDDKKDAGEMGSGHTVTALYEIIPIGVKSSFANKVDDLKYQKTAKSTNNYTGDEMLTIKLRYKLPDENTSKSMQKSINDNQSVSTTVNFRFAAAIAEFGMLLRQSEYKQNSSFAQVITLAEGAMGKDKEGYRSEFLRLAKSAQLMAKDLLSVAEIENGSEQTIK